MKMKSVLLTATLFVLSAFAVAQNFTNNFFSTTFVGTVTASQARNDSGTSTQYYFDADNSNVMQNVDIRLVDHDIPFGFASTDFYADRDIEQMTAKHPGVTVSNRGTGVYQGHQFTYLVFTYTENGSSWTMRDRYIFIGSREAYFVTQVSLASYDDSAEWGTFANQMNIVR